MGFFWNITGDYVRGYTHAIQDIINEYNYLCGNLPANKKMTVKLTKKFLDKFLEERAKFRDWRGTGKYFMRWNNQKNNFEVVVDARYKEGLIKEAYNGTNTIR